MSIQNRLLTQRYSPFNYKTPTNLELKEAGIKADRIAPVLLPLYTPEEVRKRQLTAHYEGTLR